MSRWVGTRFGQDVYVFMSDSVGRLVSVEYWSASTDTHQKGHNCKSRDLNVSSRANDVRCESRIVCTYP